MQELSNSVVTHVHGRITQTFDQEIGIPGQLGAETVGPCARPLVQPVEGTIKGVTSLLVVQVHFSH